MEKPIKLFHTFIDDESDRIYLCETLLKNNFSVWKWTNSNRITFEGNGSDLLFLILMEENMLNFSFIESKHPNPSYVSNLTIKLNNENYEKHLIELKSSYSVGWGWF
jgi:hypothetical protein